MVIFFRRLKLEIALAIPASNKWKKRDQQFSNSHLKIIKLLERKYTDINTRKAFLTFNYCKQQILRSCTLYLLNVTLFQKVDDHRKKWDRDEYEKIAKERIEEEQSALLKPSKRETPPKRDFLRPREYRASCFILFYISWPYNDLFAS